MADVARQRRGLRRAAGERALGADEPSIESIFGTGPFSPVIDVNMDGALLRGEPIDTTIKVAFVQSGDVQIELIQPVSGENLYTEFLETRGEGIHHLGYQVDELDAMKAVFTRKVGEPVFQRDMGVMEFAYFDTSEVGGLMIEFLCFKKDLGSA